MSGGMKAVSVFFSLFDPSWDTATSIASQYLLYKSIAQCSWITLLPQGIESSDS
jgi:hypothetical protein